VTELIDGVAGAMVPLWMVSLGWFRTVSMMVMSHVPMLLLGLLMVWAWMRWRRHHRWGWALALGAVSGWATITRPADAVIFALPIGVAMAAELWKRPARSGLRAAGLLVLGALRSFHFKSCLTWV